MISYQERYTILCRDVLFGSSRSDISAIGITDMINTDSNGEAKFYIVSRFNIVPEPHKPVSAVLKCRFIDSSGNVSDLAASGRGQGVAVEYTAEAVDEITKDNHDVISGGVVIGAKVQFDEGGGCRVEIYDQNNNIAGHQDIWVNFEKAKK